MNPQEQHKFNQNRFRKDWLIGKVVTAFGWLVLATFLLLIWHIFSHALPLFKSPKVNLQQTIDFDNSSSVIGLVELEAGSHFIGLDDCDLMLWKKPDSSLQERPLLAQKRFPFSCEHQILFAEQQQHNYIGVISPSNLFELYLLSQNKRGYDLVLESSIALNVASQDTTNLIWKFAKYNDFVMLTGSENTSLHHYSFDKNHPDKFQYYQLEGIDLYQAVVRSKHLLTVSNKILSIRDTQNQVVDRQLLQENLRRLFLSPSQRSFFAQDSEYMFSKWRMVNEQGTFVFRKNTEDQISLSHMIDKMVFDNNSSAALGLSENGRAHFVNRITGEFFSRQALNLRLVDAQWFAQQIYIFDKKQTHVLSTHNLSGITTLKSLFSEVWYEGYQDAEYVWQTSSAANNYEAKFSIVPLIIGSLKASFLALIVAIPLALGAAIYTAYFADPQLRQYLKPAIEMLEAVPSVIIGFIAAVWLVPIAEEFLLSLVMFIVSLPILLVAAAVLQTKIVNTIEFRVDKRWEILIVIFAVLLLGLFCFSLSDVWRFVLFGGSEQGLQLNISKTTIVVAVALGLAISPSIYSLAEDALFEVPESIKQASFALGATKLQTLRRVIIAVALPSILSAVMLGFGRAFGETMIVLMVTGNTPISDWSILEGLRSMTANLAIELQEANVNSSHFNILFLTAGILFVFTFVVNTAAEILRKRLRKVYTDA